MNDPIRRMEEHLNLPARQVLQIMQNRQLRESTYFGVKAVMSPLDFWIYQELLWELQPDAIIEIGNFAGGSTLALAHLCDQLGKGQLIGIDIDHQRIHGRVRQHPRITLIEADACEAIEEVRALLRPEDSVLIIEDSSHTYDNTLAVLRTYSSLVKLGGYFVVEDGICHHGLSEGPWPGPYEAIETFIEESDFEPDRSRESFFLTWNPKGYLRRSR